MKTVDFNKIKERFRQLAKNPENDEHTIMDVIHREFPLNWALTCEEAINYFSKKKEVSSRNIKQDLICAEHILYPHYMIQLDLIKIHVDNKGEKYVIRIVELINQSNGITIQNRHNKHLTGKGLYTTEDNRIVIKYFDTSKGDSFTSPWQRACLTMEEFNDNWDELVEQPDGTVMNYSNRRRFTMEYVAWLEEWRKETGLTLLSSEEEYKRKFHVDVSEKLKVLQIKYDIPKEDIDYILYGDSKEPNTD